MSQKKETGKVFILSERLRVGFVGTGFMTRFHIQSWRGVRHADITAICGQNPQRAQEVADLCRELRVGDPKVHNDPAALARDPNVDAIWIVGTNDQRVETIEAICEEVASGRAQLKGIACEKPLGRNVKEARRITECVEQAGLLNGYLENQVFTPALVKGRDILWRRGAALTGEPYLVRCAEEHAGPHSAWFWQGSRQGGGVLNDMLCHSVEAGRYLLSSPEHGYDWLKPKAVTARIASLKWSRPEYAQRLKDEMGDEVDYLNHPAEDYATAEIVYETMKGQLVIAQASTSWSFVGAGLRLTYEVLGPEYSLAVNTLDSEAKVFFSRNVHGPAGEDMVEKQNAEQGLMPFLADEPVTYGYTDENRHMTEAFLDGRMPRETFRDGLLVTELLMACYLSAEEGCTVKFPIADLDSFTPQVATGSWSPASLIDTAKERRIL